MRGHALFVPNLVCCPKSSMHCPQRRQATKPPICCAHMAHGCMHPRTALCASMAHPEPGVLSRAPAHFVEHNHTARTYMCTRTLHRTTVWVCAWCAAVCVRRSQWDTHNGSGAVDIDPAQQRIGCRECVYQGFFRRILVRRPHGTGTAFSLEAFN
ncbi:hypothetical protein DFH08DRAFT_811540 [Mycena albidolilacea]|uniref:Uncharacterized protein n=1 Tax=Mycena albidolilacea TaxID=1033008 RepID=A0AAD7ENT3_9AGAR|nr:hypothetical protein DFH08DRAFT_811540 [Mycena albidolilacea]